MWLQLTAGGGVQVREAVGNEAAVLGFAGAPYTLASYIVEGGSSKHYSELKRMAFSDPAVLHALLDKLTANVTDYCRYQADAGAQVRPPLALPCSPSRVFPLLCRSCKFELELGRRLQFQEGLGGVAACASA